MTKGPAPTGPDRLGEDRDQRQLGTRV